MTIAPSAGLNSQVFSCCFIAGPWSEVWLQPLDLKQHINFGALGLDLGGAIAGITRAATPFLRTIVDPVYQSAESRVGCAGGRV